MRVALAVLLLSSAVASTACPGPAATGGTGPTPLGPDAGPAGPAIARPTPPPAEPEEALYPFDEAVADALSGPLVHIGTGRWHGLFRSFSCAYHNDRVIVVIAYCAPREPKAFRVDVLHPTRGRVTIYAEAEKAPSTGRRKDWFTFKGESQPAPPASSGLPRFHLRMSYDELAEYDKQRYERFHPACWAGVEIHNPSHGCLRELAHEAEGFRDRNAAFLAEPPETYYKLMTDLRALAVRDGKAPAR